MFLSCGKTKEELDDDTEEKLAELGLSLPPLIELPPTLTLPFSFINVRARALISGHPKQDASGAIAGPFGVVGEDLTTEQAQLEARGVGLSTRQLESRDWGTKPCRRLGPVFGMVTSAPGYNEQHLVNNGFSDLILAVFGPDVGRHARSAIGSGPADGFHDGGGGRSVVEIVQCGPGPDSLRLTRSQLLESFRSQSRPAFLVMRHQDLGRQVHGFVNLASTRL